MKVCIIGCNRGVIHAQAYNDVIDAEVVGVCDINIERAKEAALKLRWKPRYYSNYQEMLSAEQPDIVHVVTQPVVSRYQWLRPCAESNVKVLVLEKPIALTPTELALFESEYEKVKDKLHVLVNHQRRYFNFAITLTSLIKEDILGAVRHVIAISCGEPMEMGTHMMDLILLACSNGTPTLITGSCWGETLLENPNYRCHDNLAMNIVFDNKIFTSLFVGIEKILRGWLEKQYKKMKSIRLNEFKEHYALRARLDVLFEYGYFWWEEYGTWGYADFNTGRILINDSDYIIDTVKAQQILSYDAVHVANSIIDSTPVDVENAIKGLKLLFKVLHPGDNHHD